MSIEFSVKYNSSSLRFGMINYSENSPNWGYTTIMPLKGINVNDMSTHCVDMQ